MIKGKDMTSEKMTLTRALVEAKAIKVKLDRVLNGSYFVSITQGIDANKKIAVSELSGKSVEEVTKEIKSTYQSAKDLIKRYNAIKRAIIQTNAATLIKVAGHEMTIAEAIERKNSISLDQRLLTTMRQNYNASVKAVETLENRLNETIDKSISQLYGSERAKITDEQIKIVSDAKKRDFDPALLDPLKLSNEISELTSSIEDFLSEVDFALSEANAKTEIQVEY